MKAVRPESITLVTSMELAFGSYNEFVTVTKPTAGEGIRKISQIGKAILPIDQKFSDRFHLSLHHIALGERRWLRPDEIGKFALLPR